MFYTDLVHHSLVAKLVTLQSALTLLHYKIIDRRRKSPQDPLLELKRSATLNRDSYAQQQETNL